MYLRLLLFMLLLAVTGASFATSLQSHDSIEKAAKQFVQDQLKINSKQSADIKMNNIDPRLRLVKCMEPLKIFIPANYKRNHNIRTVGVTCQHPKPWTIYLSIRVNIMSPVVVFTRSVNRGDVIQASDVELQAHNVTRLRFGYYTAVKSVVGMVAKQAIAANTVAVPRQIKYPKVIKRGQQVMIGSSHAGIKVNMRGKALGDGVVNQRIRVRNESSKRVIEAIVVDKHRVRVP